MAAPSLSTFFHQPRVERKTLSGRLSATRAFHQRLPGYAPTALREMPEIARSLGIEKLFVKDESSRLGLPAFKILGAAWATYRALETQLGHPLAAWETLAQLVEQLAPLRPLRLTTATDGNHGRAVAHVAKLFQLAARIFVPAGTAQARIAGIASEGAEVVVVDGTYDEAVVRAAEEASDRSIVISDTSWLGYEEIPRWVTEGYSTIFSEIDEELERRGEGSPDLIAVQFGVGALAAALVRHPWRDKQPSILSVEPLCAACGLASAAAGERITIPGPHDSIMAGMNCGRVSLIAWPVISRGIDAFLAISDERAREAMRALARAGLVAGETGAAGLAGVFEFLDHAHDYRETLGIGPHSRILSLVTEGATDPESYQRILGA